MSSISPVRIIESEREPKPILKWAGGKQALLPTLLKYFPSNFKTFYEPFFGGGSVFFALAPRSAVVGDQNSWLLDVYEAVRDDWKEVAARLSMYPNTKEDYLVIRARPPGELPLHERAAQLIYLNKTCFRGLFRVNRKGEFNVPYGAYERRYFCPLNLERVAAALAEVEFRCGDFELCLHDVQSGDFVYLDPPYYKLGGYSDFNRYTSGQFREADHVRLAALCRDLDQRGIQWVLSNSDTPFTRSLYEGFKMSSITARREINLKSSNREVSELVVRNF